MRREEVPDNPIIAVLRKVAAGRAHVLRSSSSVQFAGRSPGNDQIVRISWLVGKVASLAFWEH